jgi:hypothetical protein
MNILIIHLGTPCECLIATSLIKAISRLYDRPSIYCLAQTNECTSIFSATHSVRKSYKWGKEPNGFFNQLFDKVFMLSPRIKIEEKSIQTREIFGFGTSSRSDEFEEYMLGTKKTRKNLFQIYFNLAEMTWRGEGYDIKYYPRSRAKKTKIGIYITNPNLKNYVTKQLKLDENKLWKICHKQDFFRKMDEANKYGTIITDDFTTLNVALCLRKDVHFLKTFDTGTKIELFGNKLYNVPPIFLQSI